MPIRLFANLSLTRAGLVWALRGEAFGAGQHPRRPWLRWLERFLRRGVAVLRITCQEAQPGGSHETCRTVLDKTGRLARTASCCRFSPLARARAKQEVAGKR